MGFQRSERGQSMVELALMLPIMSFLLLGGADMARAFATQLAVQNAARSGAEATALDTTPTSSEATTHVKDELGRTPSVDAASATITVTFTQANGTSACTGAPDTSVAGTSSVATPCYAQVRVQYTWSTLIPWPLMQRSFTFDRTTMFRRYQ